MNKINDFYEMLQNFEWENFKNPTNRERYYSYVEASDGLYLFNHCLTYQSFFFSKGSSPQEALDNYFCNFHQNWKKN